MKIKILLSIFLFSASLLAQELTGLKVIQNMKYKVSEIKDYTADLEANVEMEGLRMPRIKIKMYHKAPDKYHYESKNFALLPKQGLDFNPMQYDEDKFNFDLKGTETIDNITCYIVEITNKKIEGQKKKEKVKPVKLNVYVDGVNWVPKKIETEPSERRKLEVKFEHQLVDNKFYLPAKIYLNYDIPEIADKDDLPKDTPKNIKRATKGSKGSFTIIFKNYEINKGLSDDIFKEKKRK